MAGVLKKTEVSYGYKRNRLFTSTHSCRFGVVFLGAGFWAVNACESDNRIVGRPSKKPPEQSKACWRTSLLLHGLLSNLTALHSSQSGTLQLQQINHVWIIPLPSYWSTSWLLPCRAKPVTVVTQLLPLANQAQIFPMYVDIFQYLVQMMSSWGREVTFHYKGCPIPL